MDGQLAFPEDTRELKHAQAEEANENQASTQLEGPCADCDLNTSNNALVPICARKQLKVSGAASIPTHLHIRCPDRKIASAISSACKYERFPTMPRRSYSRGASAVCFTNLRTGTHPLASSASMSAITGQEPSDRSPLQLQWLKQ
jgi:hypothetical protein